MKVKMVYKMGRLGDPQNDNGILHRVELEGVTEIKYFEDDIVGVHCDVYKGNEIRRVFNPDEVTFENDTKL